MAFAAARGEGNLETVPARVDDLKRGFGKSFLISDAEFS